MFSDARDRFCVTKLMKNLFEDVVNKPRSGDFNKMNRSGRVTSQFTRYSTSLPAPAACSKSNAAHILKFQGADSFSYVCYGGVSGDRNHVCKLNNRWAYTIRLGPGEAEGALKAGNCDNCRGQNSLLGCLKYILWCLTDQSATLG